MNTDQPSEAFTVKLAQLEAEWNNLSQQLAEAEKWRDEYEARERDQYSLTEMARTELDAALARVAELEQSSARMAQVLRHIKKDLESIGSMDGIEYRASMLDRIDNALL